MIVAPSRSRSDFARERLQFWLGHYRYSVEQGAALIGVNPADLRALDEGRTVDDAIASRVITYITGNRVPQVRAA